MTQDNDERESEFPSVGTPLLNRTTPAPKEATLTMAIYALCMVSFLILYKACDNLLHPPVCTLTGIHQFAAESH